LNSDRLRELFSGGATFEELLARPKKNKELWAVVYHRAALAPEAVARAALSSGVWHLLVLSEDWCGDSVNILPVIARLTESMPLVDMRIVGRDDNPELMNKHLTGTSRSIPVVMVFDDTFTEREWWGPRPAPLQDWVIREGLALAKDERYRQVRMWYARDRGQTIITELLQIIERLEGRIAEASD